MKEEIWAVLKLVETQGMDGLLYEVYLRHSLVLFPLIALMSNHWLKNGNIL